MTDREELLLQKINAEFGASGNKDVTLLEIGTGVKQKELYFNCVFKNATGGQLNYEGYGLDGTDVVAIDELLTTGEILPTIAKLIPANSTLSIVERKNSSDPLFFYGQSLKVVVDKKTYRSTYDYPLTPDGDFVDENCTLFDHLNVAQDIAESKNWSEAFEILLNLTGLGLAKDETIGAGLASASAYFCQGVLSLSARVISLLEAYDDLAEADTETLLEFYQEPTVLQYTKLLNSLLQSELDDFHDVLIFIKKIDDTLDEGELYGKYRFNATHAEPVDTNAINQMAAVCRVNLTRKNVKKLAKVVCTQFRNLDYFEKVFPTAKKKML